MLSGRIVLRLLKQAGSNIVGVISATILAVSLSGQQRRRNQAPDTVKKSSIGLRRHDNDATNILNDGHSRDGRRAVTAERRRCLRDRSARKK